MLNSEENSDIITWFDKENGVFLIKDSKELAKKWGITKNKPKMSFTNLSRNMRQVIQNNIILFFLLNKRKLFF